MPYLTACNILTKNQIHAVKSIPLNNGHIPHTCKIPFPMNCPKETSRKKIGRPHVTKKNRNGIRNAPEIKHNLMI